MTNEQIEKLAGKLAETMNGGMWNSTKFYNGNQKEVWIKYVKEILPVFEEEYHKSDYL